MTVTLRWLPRSRLLAAGAVALLASRVSAPPPRGSLLIVGGGAQPQELVDRFVALAGGAGHARIAVVPMASESAEETGREKAEQLVGMGAEVIVFNVTRAQAESAGTAKRLDGITGIWFSGGDQIRLTDALLGTSALAAMQARYLGGAVLGGTSAGAAIMSDSMLTGNQRQPDSLGYYGDNYPDVGRGVIEIVPGLGFLHGAIVDQHFLQRERHNRLFAVVLERPSFYGVGIDEGTALEVDPAGRWRVLGRSAVTIYDAHQGRVTVAGAPVLGATNVRIHLLPAGSTFDPRRGTATLPAR